MEETANALFLYAVAISKDVRRPKFESLYKRACGRRSMSVLFSFEKYLKDH